ncbi:MAG: hypothetical protein AB2A00_11755 [Myxococcota bacterium]
MAKPPGDVESLNKSALVGAAVEGLRQKGASPDEVAAVERVLASLPTTPERVELGCVVDVQEADGRRARYLVLPAGEGLVVGKMVSAALVTTPAAAVGKALLGRVVGERVEIMGKKGPRALQITALG